MNISLSPKMQKFVAEKVKQGRYDTPEQVIEAGLASLEQQEAYGDFASGELDCLLAEGEADIAAGRVYDGEEAFREIAGISAARRREQGK
ncbi:MAG TPA: type II toxin-antitoxin system ParD family antitoxin [Tepidisphaeraceae bacterium]|nr:type II toxin-antitoxin system ParD family antitoxin [Tepidisphaeraceae bacterium]